MELWELLGAGVAEEREEAGSATTDPQTFGASDTGGLTIDLAMEEAGNDPSLFVGISEGSIRGAANSRG